jgi:hypothetical protein
MEPREFSVIDVSQGGTSTLIEDVGNVVPLAVLSYLRVGVTSIRSFLVVNVGHREVAEVKKYGTSDDSGYLEIEMCIALKRREK